jgi:quercetin dioxygenase-like cupin family protein
MDPDRDAAHRHPDGPTLLERGGMAGFGQQLVGRLVVVAQRELAGVLELPVHGPAEHLRPLVPVLPPTRGGRAARLPGSEEITMSDERKALDTRGVTVELLATVDLGPEIEGMAGRQLRMRRVTIEPGGVFGPLHDHKGRPGTVYILQGTITDHRDGVATDYGPGAGWPEDRNTTHWLENRGTVPAVEISVDIVRQE